jgi:hypothetical protein
VQGVDIAAERKSVQFGHIRQKVKSEPGAVSHACNPGYSGGSDQEDCSVKPTQAEVSQQTSWE